jgi:cytochrome c-type biogenesis protein CcmF
VVVQALVRIDGKRYAPALNLFRTSAAETSAEAIPTPAIRSSLTRDVYVVLLSSPSDDHATLRITIFPLVAWLWAGGAVMVLGTALAAFPGRRRRPIDPVSAAIPTALDEPREPVTVG